MKYLAVVLLLASAAFAQGNDDQDSTASLQVMCKDALLAHATGQYASYQAAYHFGYCTAKVRSWMNFMQDMPTDDGQRFRLQPLRVREVIEEFLRYVSDHPESLKEDADVTLVNATQARGWLTREKASASQPNRATPSAPVTPAAVEPH
jgi:hypothetical protein